MLEYFEKFVNPGFNMLNDMLGNERKTIDVKVYSVEQSVTVKIYKKPAFKRIVVKQDSTEYELNPRIWSPLHKKFFTKRYIDNLKAMGLNTDILLKEVW